MVIFEEVRRGQGTTPVRFFSRLFWFTAEIQKF